MLPLLVTLQQGIFWMTSLTKRESLFYKKKGKKNCGNGDTGELVHPLG